MAQLSCIGVSWSLTYTPFGGWAIHFHYGVYIYIYIFFFKTKASLFTPSFAGSGFESQEFFHDWSTNSPLTYPPGKKDSFLLTIGFPW